MTDPQLTDTAREEFKAALLRSADQLLDSPKAIDVVLHFLAGNAALVLSAGELFVLPAEAAAKALRDATEPADATPEPDATPRSEARWAHGGMYL